MLDEQPKNTVSFLSFWLPLGLILMIGPNVDRLLGFSWFDALANALGISVVTLGAGFLIIVLALIGILQWLPKTDR